ncbi:hypothetical protein [Afipia broomeae]|uniref:Lectin-like protein BA14k n=1 Tax=Afipia broomeae ATCC 49717 TaxID=883078 RepID=K8PCK5_9BRAD|nr:hypothetical protein [Afipia broomeae]EKS38474.1 hypothetical protein HMPREF9695_02314 [Afipia broomeae ATCC 49717]
MIVMNRTAFAIVLTLSAPVSGVAHAQLYPPGGVGAQPVIPFPTAPPAPPPPIVVPTVPQMNSPPPFALQNTTPGVVTQDTPPKPVLKRDRRPSFSDRVARCLDDGAAWGLNPNQRAAYSRQCANQ